jgi:hypothetical protein
LRVRFGRTFLKKRERETTTKGQNSAGVDPDFDADHPDLDILARQVEHQGYIVGSIFPDTTAE